MQKLTREQVTQGLRIAGVLLFMAGYLMERPERTKSLFWWM